MNITVLSGSPKGPDSVTLQYVYFIQKQFPDHSFKIFHISSQIRQIEKEDQVFQEIIEGVRTSDGVLWAFPLYYLLVPSQYKRFIELLWEREATAVFKDKYTAVLSTSIHFFDHTAHNYMRAICDDLEMKYLGSFSAEMYDLLRQKGRQRWLSFNSEFLNGIQNRAPTSKAFSPLLHSNFHYVPTVSEKKVHTQGKQVVILTDVKDSQISLRNMIERFKQSFAEGVKVVNLHEVDMKGGCLGCLRCGYDYQCSYGHQDEFISFYQHEVRPAEILIFCGTIRDRYLSSRWKMFFDRSFFNTHTPSLTGKQVGFLISGPLTQNANLRQIMEAYTEWQGANLVDIVTDEVEDSKQLDERLLFLAQQVVHLAEKNYIKPKTFLSVAGMKIFRDDVWGRLRFPFQADHQFYKRNGLYDFPHRKYKARLINAILILLTKIPSLRREIYRKRIQKEMLRPFQKVIHGAK